MYVLVLLILGYLKIEAFPEQMLMFQSIQKWKNSAIDYVCASGFWLDVVFQNISLLHRLFYGL